MYVFHLHYNMLQDKSMNVASIWCTENEELDDIYSISHGPTFILLRMCKL